MSLSSPMHMALRLLLQANQYNTELNRDAWDFAVEIASLRAVGLTNNDLRWLLYQGYVAQAAEVTGPCDETRSFRSAGKAVLAEAGCFILTAAGVVFAESVKSGLQPPHPQDTPPSGPPPGALPSWDKGRRALCYASLLIKQFKIPAPNQEIILATFEEEHWAQHIDDPLAPHAAIDPKRRLHDTINSLNRNQKNQLLRFFGDGTGEGVCWEPVTRANSYNGKADASAGRTLILAAGGNFCDVGVAAR